MDTFLKWAGGKRWLINKSGELLPDMKLTNRYIEPFLGGGSMYFHLEPNVALLSDINEDLINAYAILRDNWYDLFQMLKKYQKQHSHDFYYRIRSSKPRSPICKAARLIYLNRTCWNGLYRVNKKGEFNVPIGTKTTVILSNDDFERLSNLLKKADLEVCDFEATINKAEENDFIFIDPPYTVKHNLNGFIKYNETIFSWQDQVRLRNSITKAISRGAKVLVTNANHKSIEELYEGCGKMYLLNRASVIAGNAEARGIYSELAITNW
jgi:DNA adenine methylase